MKEVGASFNFTFAIIADEFWNSSARSNCSISIKEVFPVHYLAIDTINPRLIWAGTYKTPRAIILLTPTIGMHHKYIILIVGSIPILTTKKPTRDVLPLDRKHFGQVPKII
jgi:hypothetical protein